MGADSENADRAGHDTATGPPAATDANWITTRIKLTGGLNSTLLAGRPVSSSLGWNETELSIGRAAAFNSQSRNLDLFGMRQSLPLASRERSSRPL
jgi:hypothetical protein